MPRKKKVDPAELRDFTVMAVVTVCLVNDPALNEIDAWPEGPLTEAFYAAREAYNESARRTRRAREAIEAVGTRG